MNERIKELRKALDLTLEKFATPLGVQRSAINKIEKGENRVSDQMFLSICREYNVNPEWLKTGKGNIFQEGSDNVVKWAEKTMSEYPFSFKSRFLNKLYSFSDSDWKALESVASAVTDISCSDGAKK